MLFYVKPSEIRIVSHTVFCTRGKNNATWFSADGLMVLLKKQFRVQSLRLHFTILESKKVISESAILGAQKHA